MLAALLIMITFLTAFICRRFLLTNILSPRMPISVRIAAGLAAIAMLILFPPAITEIKSSLSDRNWPTTIGIITETKIGGGKAYRPEVHYCYSVEGKDYDGLSHLHAPGFGGKNQRYDTAKKLLEGYNVGNDVTVHYDPKDHSHSILITAVKWDTYVKPGFYLIILLAAFALLLNGHRPLKNCYGHGSGSGPPPNR